MSLLDELIVRENKFITHIQDEHAQSLFNKHNVGRFILNQQWLSWGIDHDVGDELLTRSNRHILNYLKENKIFNNDVIVAAVIGDKVYSVDLDRFSLVYFNSHSNEYAKYVYTASSSYRTVFPRTDINNPIRTILYGAYVKYAPKYFNWRSRKNRFISRYVVYLTFRKYFLDGYKDTPAATCQANLIDIAEIPNIDEVISQLH